jgi:hypothetical protein
VALAGARVAMDANEVEKIRDDVYDRAWEAWSSRHPDVADQQRGAFMMGFQTGLIAAELGGLDGKTERSGA